MAGGILSLSAAGTSNAILWANEAFGNLPSDPDANLHSTPNVLVAYDVSAIAVSGAAGGTLTPIWSSEAEPNDRVGESTKFSPPLVANGRVYQATYDGQVVVYGLGAASATPLRDIRRTVIFIYGQTIPGQDLFLRGGTKGGGSIRIQHRNWLNGHSNAYRFGDANLDMAGVELGQMAPAGRFGGGSPTDWTTSLAQGQGQPYASTAGFGISDENSFGANYWMLDVDMDCEQAFDDGKGNKWFELKALIAPRPGPEGNVTQVSTPAPPYASPNHMGLCGMVNVFVADFPNLPAGLDPNSAQFIPPSYTYLWPVDDRTASDDVLKNTPCVSPNAENRCVGSISQSCQSVSGGNFFRTVQNCNMKPAGGNYGQMCQKSTGLCCSPDAGNICQ
jgi:hypothetical protein